MGAVGFLSCCRHTGLGLLPAGEGEARAQPSHAFGEATVPRLCLSAHPAWIQPPCHGTGAGCRGLLYTPCVITGPERIGRCWWKMLVGCSAGEGLAVGVS